MMRSFFVLVLVLALLVGIAAQRARAQVAPATASEDATVEARTHFKLGVDLYRERNFRAALIEFQRAYSASPHYKLLYNLGQTALELHEDTSALEYFGQYLVRGEAEIAADRRQEVEDTIARLEARQATLTISTNQEGASVYVDSGLAGTTPLPGPLKVSVGRHTVSTRKGGYLQVDRVVDVAAGDHRELALELVPEPAPTAALQEAHAATGSAPDHSVPASTWLAIATGGLAAGAISLAIATAVAERSYVEEKRELTTSKALSALRNDAETKALVADVLWSAAAVSAVATTVMFLVEGNEERESASERADYIHVGVGAASLTVQGRF